MLESLEDSFHAPSSPRIIGVTPATVVENLDVEGQGRMKVSFPWMPDVQPWARMCAPVAGDGAGIWAIPQIGDEVLVAFANGDVTQPYVLGGLWGMKSHPPAALPVDSQDKQIVKTPRGHTITLDDGEQEITVEHLLGHKIEMTASGIKLSTTGGAASIELTSEGAIKIRATTSAEIAAADVTVSGDVSAKLTGNASVELSASGPCTVAGALVRIN